MTRYRRGTRLSSAPRGRRSARSWRRRWRALSYGGPAPVAASGGRQRRPSSRARFHGAGDFSTSAASPASDDRGRTGEPGDVHDDHHSYANARCSPSSLFELLSCRTRGRGGARGVVATPPRRRKFAPRTPHRRSAALDSASAWRLAGAECARAACVRASSGRSDAGAAARMAALDCRGARPCRHRPGLWSVTGDPAPRIVVGWRSPSRCRCAARRQGTAAADGPASVSTSLACPNESRRRVRRVQLRALRDSLNTRGLAASKQATACTASRGHDWQHNPSCLHWAACSGGPAAVHRARRRRHGTT